MQVLDGNVLPVPMGLLKREEQEALAPGGDVPIAVELRELSDQEVCARAIDMHLWRRKHARADLERADGDDRLCADARRNLALTDRKLEIVANVAGPVLAYEVENELKRAV